jgi:catechol 2,3-dioxygenase-like lactoylglutathione lyase family enzyme
MEGSDGGPQGEDTETEDGGTEGGGAEDGGHEDRGTEGEEDGAEGEDGHAGVDDRRADVDDQGAEALHARDVIEVVGLDHIQLAMPPDGEEEARRFYVDVLGFREVAKPPELAGRGGCWFAAEGLAIHLGVERAFRPATKAHPALLVRDLGAAREALGTNAISIEEDYSGLPVRRCYVRDPFGNRIELIDERDAGFSLG